ncbi:MAG: hypothetical protein RBT39_02865 [Azoarcus sp.]|nr:hypothetical protein [Azoarcus sp.]
MTTLQTTLTPCEALGGAPALQRLVTRFYALMDTLPEAFAVRQFHPESLAGSAQTLFEFVSGWFGGPSLYITKKGHPRLRMRHAPRALCGGPAHARRVDALHDASAYRGGGRRRHAR